MRWRLPLLGILVVAALLRFTGLGWGLRHRPQLDERFFVSNTVHMLERGDLDHGFYQYPGLFYYLLAPVVALVGSEQGPTAYLAGRAFVGCFGLLSVLLVYALGRSTWGTSAGLFAAALLAVSPLEVRVAHEVRPDVPLHSFVLLGFLAFRGIGERARRDAVSGAALGAATAVKFSGALLVPSYLVRRLLMPGPKLRRLALAGLVSLGTFAALSPYTFLKGAASVQGMDDQLSFHYAERGTPLGFLGAAAVYGAVLVEALGPPAVALAAAGLVVGVRRWRDWLPLLVLLLVTVAVFSTGTTITQDRFLVPVLGATALLAGPVIEALARRSRGLLVAVAVAAVSFPLFSSISYVRSILQPITRDEAADWIEAHLGTGRVVATVNAAVGLDPRRFETLRIGLLNSRTRLQAVSADLVVTGPGADRAALVGLQRLFVAEPLTRYSGERIRVYGIPETLRPRYVKVPLSGATLTASEGEAALPAVADGDAGTAWRTAAGQTPGEWVQVELPRPVLLGRIEIVPPADADEAADDLEVFASEGEPRLGRVPVLPGRPGIAQQMGPVSQVLLVPEARVLTLRLVQVGHKAKPWGIAELRLDAIVKNR